MFSSCRTVILFVLLALLPAGSVVAGIVVVANPAVGIAALSRDDVINIFLGRFRTLSSGVAAQPVDLPASEPEKEGFYHLLVNKDLATINAYWARLVFSGRTTPPRQAQSTEDLIRFVSSTPGAVGYLDRTKVDGRVKIVFELEQ